MIAILLTSTTIGKQNCVMNYIVILKLFIKKTYCVYKYVRDYVMLNRPNFINY